jgi:hypothetical protein
MRYKPLPSAAIRPFYPSRTLLPEAFAESGIPLVHSFNHLLATGLGNQRFEKGALQPPVGSELEIDMTTGRNPGRETLCTWHGLKGPDENFDRWRAHGPLNHSQRDSTQHGGEYEIAPSVVPIRVSRRPPLSPLFKTSLRIPHSRPQSCPSGARQPQMYHELHIARRPPTSLRNAGSSHFLRQPKMYPVHAACEGKVSEQAMERPAGTQMTVWHAMALGG